MKTNQVGVSVAAATMNMETGEETLGLPLEKRGDQVEVTPDLAGLISGASSRQHMAWVLEKKRVKAKITPMAVEAATGSGESGEEMRAF